MKFASLTFWAVFSLSLSLAHADGYVDRAIAEREAQRLLEIDRTRMDAARGKVATSMASTTQDQRGLNGVDIFFILFLLVSIAVVVSSHINAKNRKEEIRIRVAQKVAEYRDTLLEKRNELVYRDDYGIERTEKWLIEIGYFIENVLAKDKLIHSSLMSERDGKAQLERLVLNLIAKRVATE